MAKKKQQQGVIDVNETINKSEAFFNQYKKPLLGALIALIVIIAGLFLYKEYVSGPREDKASTALGKGQEYFNSDQFDKALNGDGAGYAGFLKIASDFGSTDAGNLAKLYAGLCYANLDKWNEAVKYLDQYSPANDAMVSPAAIAALGNAYAHVNQLDKAVSTLTNAADKADKQGKDGVNNSLAPTFRLQAAQILESQGKKDEALKIYEGIKSKYVNSALVQSQEIDKYIQRLSTK
ncbi:MAG: tetratricopeptide repeat protein [Prevotella sp.]|nr:tetratricopeptide repeat protein [Prevotella sp.]MBQ6208435.1 tetratricopeptide repeat protein [Prevotella sp.]